MLYELGEVKALDFAGHQSAANAAGGAGGGMGSGLGELLDLVFTSSVSAHPHPVHSFSKVFWCFGTSRRMGADRGGWGRRGGADTILGALILKSIL
jgi:hypothetical protein